jgi:hypothetical protein
MKYECGALEELYEQREAETIGKKASPVTHFQSQTLCRDGCELRPPWSKTGKKRICPAIILKLRSVVVV